MQTLYNLCLNIIYIYKLNTFKLPNVILMDLKILEINKICNKKVSQITNSEYVKKKIHYITKNKMKIINFIIKYEKEAKQGIYQAWYHFEEYPSLVLYYIKQEPDFETWYRHTNLKCRCYEFLKKIGA